MDGQRWTGYGAPVAELSHLPSSGFDCRLHHPDGQRTLQDFVPGAAAERRLEHFHQKSTETQFSGGVVIIHIESRNIDTERFRKSPHQSQHGSVGKLKINAEIRFRGNFKLTPQRRISLLPHHLDQTSVHQKRSSGLTRRLYVTAERYIMIDTSAAVMIHPATGTARPTNT